MKIKKIPYTAAKKFLSTKLIAMIILASFVIVLAFLGWFLYKDFYQTITQSQQIIVLRSEVSPYTVDVDKFNKALQSLEQKVDKNSQLVNWPAVKNPFGINTGSNRPTVPGID
ncbi:MAG: hypothetical protein RB292_02645 [Patescibacteria group bacterium]|jgi:predicted PurR-regulated permease PerM|nr:hypothetical protein [Patescibacteria group bacterium]